MKLKYIELLNEELESERFDSGATLEAMTVMSNHSHEMFDVLAQEPFSNQMRRHHSRYGAHFNKARNRCGKVAQGRPHTTLLGNDHRAMETAFYIHANPIRANIVKDAKDYYFSTHRLYAFGKRELWMRNIKLPGWYIRLGRTPKLRQRKYRRLFARYLAIFGRFKQGFLRSHFYGPAEWVAKHTAALKEWRREHASLAPS